MPAKPSGEVKTRIIQNVQKNGDIYILKRETMYDPVKKYNRILSTTLISKIPKGTTMPVPTRAKRNKSDKSIESSGIQTERITASR